MSIPSNFPMFIMYGEDYFDPSKIVAMKLKPSTGNTTLTIVLLDGQSLSYVFSTEGQARTFAANVIFNNLTPIGSE